MPHAGKHHGHAGFVSSSNHFGVAHRAAWLNHRADAVGSCIIDAVTEREEGIGGHDGTLNLQAGMLGLDGGNACRVDAAHLAGADTDRLAVAGVDNGIGFDELGHFPGEDQVVHFLFGRRALGHHLEVGFSNHADVATLNQQAAVNLFEVPTGGALGAPLATLEQAHVGLGGHYYTGSCTDLGCDDHFDELAIDNGLGGITVQLTVESNDAAEGGFVVGIPGQIIGLANAAIGFRYYRNATGIGVFYDYAGRLAEAFYAFQRGIGIGHVVE